MLVAAVVLFDGPTLLGRISLDSDNVFFYIPFYSLAREAPLLLWDPYSVCGLPLLGNLQYALLYPLRLVFVWFDTLRVYGPFCFAHWVIGGIGAYVLGRTIGVCRFAALVGAMSFACGGFIQGRVSNPSLFFTAVWFPLVVAAAIRASTLPSPRSSAFLAFSFFFLSGGGSPHNIFFAVVAVGLIFLFALAGHPLRVYQDAPPATRRGILGSGIFALCLSLAMFAPVWWHAIELLPRTIRRQASFADVTEGGLLWSELPRLWIGGLGTPEFADKTSFQGLLALAFVVIAGWHAVVAKVTQKRRFTVHPIVIFAVGLCVLGILTALGAQGGIYHLIYAIPGFRFLIGPARGLILFNTGWCILIMWATHRVLPSIKPPRLLLIVCALVCISFLAWAWFDYRWRGVFFAFSHVGTISHVDYLRIVVPFWLGVVGLALWIASRPTLPWHWRAAVLLTVHVTNLWHFHQRQYLRFEDTQFFSPSPTVERLRALPKIGETRILCYDPLRLHVVDMHDTRARDFLMSKLSDYYQLREVQGYDPLILRDYVDFVTLCGGRSPVDDPFRTVHVANPLSVFADVTGARYLVGNPYVRILTRDPYQRDVSLSPQRATAIHFISVCTNSHAMPEGAVVGYFIIQGRDGDTTRVPVRLGRETADILATNPTTRCTHPHPPTAQRWLAYYPPYNRKVWLANYVGRIPLEGTPEIIRIGWRPRDGSLANFVVLAYGIESPAQSSDHLVNLTPTEAIAPIYENLRAVPLAYLVHETTLAETLRDTIAILSGHRDMLTSLAVVHDPAHVLALLGNEDPDDRVEILAYKGGDVCLRVRVARPPAILVLTESHYPGWRVWVNGRESPVLRVNGVFQGVRLDTAGTNLVRFAYWPRSFLWTFLVASIGFLGGVIALMVSPRREKTNEVAAGDTQVSILTDPAQRR